MCCIYMYMYVHIYVFICNLTGCVVLRLFSGTTSLQLQLFATISSRVKLDPFRVKLL